MNHNNNLKTFNARSTNPCSNTLSSSDLKFKIQQALPNQIEFFSVNSRFSITFVKMRKCSFRAFQNQIILQIPKHSRSFNALVFECVHKGKSKIFLLYYTKGMLHQQNLKIKEISCSFVIQMKFLEVGTLCIYAGNVSFLWALVWLLWNT